MKQIHAVLAVLLPMLPVASPGAEDPPPVGPGRARTFTVQAFGARGDGRSDDGPALQRAIDAAIAAADLAFLRPVTDAVVSGCEFRTQLKTALLVYPPCVVSECVFEDVAYGIHAPFPGTLEGPPPHGLRVDQCRFARPGVAAIALHLPSLESGPPGRRALEAGRCRIDLDGGRGLALAAYHQSGILLRGTDVRAEDGRTWDALVRLHDCTDVRRENAGVAPLAPSVTVPAPTPP